MTPYKIIGYSYVGGMFESERSLMSLIVEVLGIDKFLSFEATNHQRRPVSKIEAKFRTF